MYLSTARARFNNVEFDGNSALRGGALYVKSGSTATFYGCSFCENSATILGPVIAYAGILGETVTIWWDSNCTGITANDVIIDPNE